MGDLLVREVGAESAVLLRDVIHAAFGARPRLDPPSTALAETRESLAETLARSGGLLCLVDGTAAGCMLFEDRGRSLALRRVSVVPHFQSRGVATALVGVAEEVAATRGFDDVELLARDELPSTLRFWHRRGYAELHRSGSAVRLGKALPVELVLPTAEATCELGIDVASLVQAGDVLLLVGELGAGKTTFTQGLARGLRVRGDVTSPTFVISRIHPALVEGPSLVHVDGYRLGDDAELDDLDLDAYVEGAVTVVEWGEGLAEALSSQRLRVRLMRTTGDAASDGRHPPSPDETRVATVTPVGARWFGIGLRSGLLTPAPLE